jgi:diguanylate cyclase (GGDEF)-like protein
MQSGSLIRTSAEREAAREEAARRGVWHDRLVRRGALLAAGWVAAYAVTSALVADHQALAAAVGKLVYLVPVAVATVASLLAARATASHQRSLWQVLFCSNLLWLGGEAIWAVYHYVLHREPPFPSVADALYLASYLLVLPAIVLGFRGALATRVWRALLDASTMLVALAVGGYTLLIGPQLAWGFSLATATGIAYPLFGMAILMLLGTLAFTGHRQVPQAVRLVAIAFAASALTDVGYTYLTVLHEYVPVSLLNVGWQVEAVLLSLAGLVATRHPDLQASVVTLPRDRGLPLILAGLVATLTVIAIASPDEKVTVPTALVGAYAVAAVVARLMLTARENRRIASQLADALAEQERLAVTDGLTGLHNRRFFEELLRLEVDRTVRSGQELGLVVVDADRFKQVNDEHGHQAGDLVLRELATRLATTARASDVVARYGGEEFVLVLAGTDCDQLARAAERCRSVVRERPFRLPGGEQLWVTVSVGGACLPDHANTVDELVRTADRALYAAKDQGRDQVVIADLASAQPPTGPAKPDPVTTGVADPVQLS